MSCETDGSLLFACDAILFDCDGVLVDSMAVWTAWALRHGLEPGAVLAAIPGRRSVDLVPALAPHLSPEDEAAELLRLELEHVPAVRAVAGAAPLLESLPAGSWAVVTSGSRDLALARLGAASLPAPDVLVAADDVVAGKPDPEGYALAASRLGADPAACLVVEDAPAGVRAARAAGMRVVALTTTHAPADLAQADAGVADLRGVAAVATGAPCGRLAVTVASAAR